MRIDSHRYSVETETTVASYIVTAPVPVVI